MHGLYYLLMHGWFRVFAPTQLWARAPSALAIGGAAAGIVVLATQFGSRSVAVCSGVMFAVLPRASWAGVEARPYAMSTMAAVWITVLFAVALRRGRTVRWVCYAAAVALSIVLDVYLVLMVVAHLGFLVAVRARRAATIRFAVAAVAALALAAPFMPFARRQSAQLGWIPPLSARTIIDVGVKQYFDRSVPFAILAALVVGTWIQLRRKDAKPGEPQIVWLTLTWVAIPTVLALGYSAVVTPIYYPRYLCFTAPAVAVLLGTCIAVLAQTPLRAATFLVLFALAAFPNYLCGQRGPYSKYGMDYSQVADLVKQKAPRGRLPAARRHRHMATRSDPSARRGAPRRICEAGGRQPRRTGSVA